MIKSVFLSSCSFPVLFFGFCEVSMVIIIQNLAKSAQKFMGRFTGITRTRIFFKIDTSTRVRVLDFFPGYKGWNDDDDSVITGENSFSRTHLPQVIKNIVGF